jgi:hypothetical protein
MQNYLLKLKSMTDAEIEAEHQARKNWRNLDEKEKFEAVQSAKRNRQHKQEVLAAEKAKEAEILKLAEEYNETIRFWKANGVKMIDGYYYTFYQFNESTIFEFRSGEKFKDIMPRMRAANEKFKEEISWQN